MNVRAPFFTEAQRQELERQTMIYKYMTTSVPVPPQLLIPTITKTPKSFARMHYSNRKYLSPSCYLFVHLFATKHVQSSVSLCK